MFYLSDVYYISISFIHNLILAANSFRCWK